MSIIIQSLGFEWPNGDIVFNNLNFSIFQNEKVALVGQNGSGKSTLLKLITKQLLPTNGSVTTKNTIAYYQQFETPPAQTVAQYLVDVWEINDIEPSLHAQIISNIPLERSCQQLSGGQWNLCRIIKTISSTSNFIIMDEPSNHLDTESRSILLQFIKTTSKGLLIVSHDRSILQCVEKIFELTNLGLSVYGGNWDLYHKQRLVDKNAIEQKYAHLKKEMSLAQQKRIDQLKSQEKRAREGKNKAIKTGMSKIEIGAKKQQSQKSKAKKDVFTNLQAIASVQQTKEHYLKIKEESEMYLKISTPASTKSQRLFQLSETNLLLQQYNQRLWKDPINFTMWGTDKLILTGKNGSGKSTLLSLITNQKHQPWTIQGEVIPIQVSYSIIDQHFRNLSPEQSVLDNIMTNSHLPQDQIRSQLAQFLFKGEKVYHLVKDLSGGEKLRVALAKLFIQKTPPQLLILDEPTNNLDLINLQYMELFLKQYQGPYIVVSHDHHFLQNINYTKELHLSSNESSEQCLIASNESK